MKIYKNIQEFLNDNPSEEVIARIMSTINRGSIAEGRKELKEKSERLDRISRVIAQMEKHSIPVGSEVKEVYNNLAKEIKALTKAIPPSPYSRKKVEDPKAEE
jgi:hypothetical protein